MSLKKVQRITEGPLDFARGAMGAAGSKIANSAPVQAVKRNVGDVVQAGQAASTLGNFTAAVQKFAQVLVQYDKLRNTSDDQPQQQPEPTPPAGTPAGPAVQAKQAELAQARQQRQVGGPADAFRTGNGAPGKVGKNGFEYTFNSFLMGTHGEQINEGVWDFVKGAGAAVAGKARDKINSYADQPSVFKDIYHAGKEASAKGNAAKAGAQFAKVKQQAQDQLKQLSALYAQLGDKGPAAIKQAVLKLPPPLQQRIVVLVQRSAQKAPR